MTRRRKIGLVADRELLKHQIPGNIRESPKRLWPLYQRIDAPYFSPSVIRVPSREASEQEITAVHSELYLSQLRQHAISTDPFSYDKDTYLMEDTLYVAALAAGSCLALGDALMRRDIDTGLALIRPPGHHAGSGGGGGFCVFNHAAILARYLQREHHLERILILDVDAHHGNGTQEIFWTDPGVLFVSIHEENLFPPKSGDAAEIGSAAGEGYTVNVPVKSGFGDLEYRYIVSTVIQDLIARYAPQIALISMGFDTHIDDPISNLALTTSWYRWFAATLGWYAHTENIAGPLYILEGGYLPSTLEQSVMSLFDGMVTTAAPGAVPFSPRADFLLTNTVLPHLPDK